MKTAAWRLAGGLLLAGCTPLGLWLYVEPVVTVSRITLQLGRAKPSPVIVALDLDNENDYPISAERVELSLRLDGIPIGQLKRDSRVDMATDTVARLALPLVLARQTTPQRLRALGSGTRRFAVRGRATFRTPFGTRTVRFAQEGSLVFGSRSNGSRP